MERSMARCMRAAEIDKIMPFHLNKPNSNQNIHVLGGMKISRVK